MKLKNAIKLAKELNFDFVAVDEVGYIFAYEDAPHTSYSRWYAEGNFAVLGVYTGSKLWKNTLREVK